MQKASLQQLQRKRPRQSVHSSGVNHNKPRASFTRITRTYCYKLFVLKVGGVLVLVRRLGSADQMISRFVELLAVGLK